MTTKLAPATISCQLRWAGLTPQRHKDHVTVANCPRPRLVSALDKAFPAQQFDIKRVNEQWEVRAR